MTPDLALIEYTAATLAKRAVELRVLRSVSPESSVARDLFRCVERDLHSAFRELASEMGYKIGPDAPTYRLPEQESDK